MCINNMGVKVEESVLAAPCYRLLCSLALSFMSARQTQPLNVGTHHHCNNSQHDVVHMLSEASTRGSHLGIATDGVVFTLHYTKYDIECLIICSVVTTLPCSTLIFNSFTSSVRRYVGRCVGNLPFIIVILVFHIPY